MLIADPALRAHSDCKTLQSTKHLKCWSIWCACTVVVDLGSVARCRRFVGGDFKDGRLVAASNGAYNHTWHLLHLPQIQKYVASSIYCNRGKYFREFSCFSLESVSFADQESSDLQIKLPEGSRLPILMLRFYLLLNLPFFFIFMNKENVVYFHFKVKSEFIIVCLRERTTQRGM